MLIAIHVIKSIKNKKVKIFTLNCRVDLYHISQIIISVNIFDRLELLGISSRTFCHALYLTTSYLKCQVENRGFTKHFTGPN